MISTKIINKSEENVNIFKSKKKRNIILNYQVIIKNRIKMFKVNKLLKNK